eukprot:RCo022712
MMDDGADGREQQPALARVRDRAMELCVSCQQKCGDVMCAEVHLQPWGEFFDGSRVSCPSLPEVLPRVHRNLRYFLGNYGCVVVLLAAVCLASSVGYLVAFLGLCGVWWWFCRREDEPVILGSCEISRAAGYVVLGVVTIILASTMFSAFNLRLFLVLSTLSVVGHTILYVDYLPLDGAVV